jgi:hypothetical protein
MPVATRNLSQYEEIHRSTSYVNAGRWRRYIRPWVEELRPHSILDYGCGRSSMVTEFDAKIKHAYDPAIPGSDTIPLPRYDMVLCIDVMEHLDEPEVDQVFAEIAGLTGRALFLIDTVEAKTILPNGENAHATIRSYEWWRSQLAKHFPVVERIATGRRVGLKTWRSSPFAHIQAAIWRTIAKFG